MRASGCLTTSEQVVATVLQIVVQHATVQRQEVCTCLQLSKVIRRALQQAIGDLLLGADVWTANIKRLTAMARWLPCHAELVSSLLLQRHREAQLDSEEWAAVEQMLTFALQLSGSTTSGEDARPSALQLKSFQTDFVLQPAALRSLAASSQLTQLRLERVPPTRLTAELCSALSRLRGLRELCLELHEYPARDDTQPFPMDFSSAVAQLTQLTQLSAIGCLPVAGLGRLPASLCELRVGTGQTGGSAAAGGPSNVCISSLTKLQSLYLTALDGISAQSQLPACLTALTLIGPAEAVPGLSRLQRLLLNDAHAAAALLQPPKQRPQMQRLKMGLHSCSQQRLQRIADALSSCTQLTALHLYNYDSSLSGVRTGQGQSLDGNMSGVRLQLQGLRQLQRLKLSNVKWDFEGFSQLTVLSSLTKLKADACDIADAGLALAFQRLTGLRKLVLWTPLPNNACLLVAMACLSNLEHLDFGDEDSCCHKCKPTRVVTVDLVGISYFAGPADRHRGAYCK